MKYMKEKIQKAYDEYCRKLDRNLRMIQTIQADIQQSRDKIQNLLAEANKLNGKIEAFEELNDWLDKSNRGNYLPSPKEEPK